MPGFSRTSNVFLVLAEFGRTHEQAALDLLVPTLQRLFPGAMVRGAIVDNARAGEADAAIGDGLVRVSGDNTVREFSGWDCGIAWLQHRHAPAPDSIVVLANDSVVREDKRDRVRGVPEDRGAAAACGALAGWIDEYPRTVELFGLELRQWVDTSLVFATHRTLGALIPLSQPVRDDLVFDDDWRRIFRDPSPLSENYRTYLKSYFLGSAADPDFDHRWYAQAPLTGDTFDAFKRKLQCVFCEHLLSARARALRIPLVDIRPQALPIDPVDEVQVRG